MYINVIRYHIEHMYTSNRAAPRARAGPSCPSLRFLSLCI